MSEYQHWDFSIDVGIQCLGYAITKYICRHRKKNGLRDLEKCEHFLRKLRSCAAEGRLLPPKLPHDFYNCLTRFHAVNAMTDNERTIFNIACTWNSTAGIDLAIRLLDDVRATYPSTHDAA